MKKIITTLMMFVLINFSLNALTIKEKIQEDLSKIGVKQEIIDETIKLDKELVTFNTIVFDENGNEVADGSEKWEKLYQKDKKNFIALEKLIMGPTLNEESENVNQKDKYISEYLKLNIPEDRKNFFLGEKKWAEDEDKTAKNQYFEKVKASSNNQYYLKKIDFYEYLGKENKKIEEDYEKDTKIDLKKSRKELKEKSKEITDKISEIDKILENKKLREEYRISDEEAYSIQLDNLLITGSLKVLIGDSEGMIKDFINVANKDVSKEVAEYNKVKEIGSVGMIMAVTLLGGLFGDENLMELETLEKLTTQLENTKMYKRFESFSKSQTE